MAQALEKIFLQKVALMPQEEVELLPPAPKGKGRKSGPGKGVVTAMIIVGLLLSNECLYTLIVMLIVIPL